MALSEEHKAKMRAGREEWVRQGSPPGKRAQRRSARPARAEDPLYVPQPADDNQWADFELSESEKEAIDAEIVQRLKEEAAAARAERKKEARAAYIQSRIDAARAGAGETQTAAALKRYNEEEVWITIRMPRAKKAVGFGRHDPEPIILDQRIYTHGKHIPVTRAVAVQLLDIMDKAHRAQRVAEGDSMVDFNPQTFELTYQGGKASGGGSPGMSFAAIHRRPERAVST